MNILPKTTQVGRVGKLVNAATKDCLLAELYGTKVKAVLVPVPPIFDIYNSITTLMPTL